MHVEAPRDSNAPDQQEAVGDSDAPRQQENARDKEESTLGNLSPTSDVASSMDMEEYNRALKELGGDEQSEAEFAHPKEVLATIVGLEQEAEDEANPSDRGPSHSGTPPSRVRHRALPDLAGVRTSEHEEYLTPEELVEQAGIGAIAHTEVLNKTITPDEAAYPGALEATRKEMLATARKISNTAMAMLEERQEAQEVMDGFLKRECEAVDSLQKAKKL
jgi:hypothetical protein